MYVYHHDIFKITAESSVMCHVTVVYLRTKTHVTVVLSFHYRSNLPIFECLFSLRNGYYTKKKTCCDMFFQGKEFISVKY